MLRQVDLKLKDILSILFQYILHYYNTILLLLSSYSSLLIRKLKNESVNRLIKTIRAMQISSHCRNLQLVEEFSHSNIIIIIL